VRQVSVWRRMRTQGRALMSNFYVQMTLGLLLMAVLLAAYIFLSVTVRSL
jgi:hypothetical protein